MHLINLTVTLSHMPGGISLHCSCPGNQRGMWTVRGHRFTEKGTHDGELRPVNIAERIKGPLQSLACHFIFLSSKCTALYSSIFYWTLTRFSTWSQNKEQHTYQNLHYRISKILICTVKHHLVKEQPDSFFSIS